jgi:hypothetical protein
VETAASARGGEMKDEIKQILNDLVWWLADSETCGLDQVEISLYGVDEAADAIMELMERQPVDKIQAMAVLTSRYYDQYYVVPHGDGGNFHVWRFFDDWCCNCSIENRNNCDHIKAVRLYLEQEK